MYIMHASYVWILYPSYPIRLMYYNIMHIICKNASYVDVLYASTVILYAESM